MKNDCYRETSTALKNDYGDSLLGYATGIVQFHEKLRENVPAIVNRRGPIFLHGNHKIVSYEI